ncbi:MAG TPA: protein kinase [Candidatus Binatia bacterium]|nr:protein kinase [Candidatus Binatia bacterium]
MTLVSGTRLGPYEVIAPLGAGGMGEVYRARDTRLGREVAIKILPHRGPASAEERARFRREAKTISSLNHPHICVLHDIGQEGDTDYLVMELIEGETLARRIAKGPLPTAEVLRIGAQIADALDRAHRAGVVHRDLKPGNVMLTKSGAKLMDFGLAREFTPTGRDPEVTVTERGVDPDGSITKKGMIVGTFQYMSPEQLEGKRADGRSDIWALGCVLYEMATGKRAFEGSTPVSVISAIMRDEPRRISDLVPLTPPAFERSVRQCLDKDPDGRWQSAADLRRELLWVLEAGSQAGIGAPPAARRRRRQQVVWAVALSLTLLIASSAVVAIRAMKSRTDQPLFTKLTFTPMTIQRAAFAPDMRTIVFSASTQGNIPQIYVLRPESPEPQPLSEPGMHFLSVSSRGELAILTGARLLDRRAYIGTLARMPLGGGAPREILTDVTEADWTPDGTALAVIRVLNDNSGRSEGNYEQLEFPIGHVIAKGRFSYLTFSPDGDRLAYFEGPSRWSGEGALMVVDRRGREKALLNEYRDEEGLAWAPDGKELFFSVNSSGDHAIYAVSLAGARRIALRSAGGLTIHDIAPNGRWLATQEDVRCDVMVHRPEWPTDRSLTWLDYSSDGKLSGDGRKVAFSEESSEDSLSSVCLRNVEGGSVVRLGEGRPMDLSADGKWVITGGAGKIMLQPTGAGEPRELKAGEKELTVYARFNRGGDSLTLATLLPGQDRRNHYFQSLAGGELRKLTTDLPPVLFGVSRDGNRLLCRKGQRLFMVPRQGGPWRELASLGPEENPYHWSADEQSVMVCKRGIPLRVERMNLETGRRTLFAEISPPNLTGLESVFLTDISADDRSYAYDANWRRSTMYAIAFSN